MSRCCQVLKRKPFIRANPRRGLNFPALTPLFSCRGSCPRRKCSCRCRHRRRSRSCRRSRPCTGPSDELLAELDSKTQRRLATKPTVFLQQKGASWERVVGNSRVCTPAVGLHEGVAGGGVKEGLGLDKLLYGATVSALKCLCKSLTREAASWHPGMPGAREAAANRACTATDVQR